MLIPLLTSMSSGHQPPHRVPIDPDGRTHGQPRSLVDTSGHWRTQNNTTALTKSKGRVRPCAAAATLDVARRAQAELAAARHRRSAPRRSQPLLDRRRHRPRRRTHLAPAAHQPWRRRRGRASGRPIDAVELPGHERKLRPAGVRSRAVEAGHAAERAISSRQSRPAITYSPGMILFGSAASLTQSSAGLCRPSCSSRRRCRCAATRSGDGGVQLCQGLLDRREPSEQRLAQRWLDGRRRQEELHTHNVVCLVDVDRDLVRDMDRPAHLCVGEGEIPGLNSGSKSTRITHHATPRRPDRRR